MSRIDEYIASQSAASPAFARAYARAAVEIAATDRWVNTLIEGLVARGVDLDTVTAAFTADTDPIRELRAEVGDLVDDVTLGRAAGLYGLA